MSTRRQTRSSTRPSRQRVVSVDILFEQANMSCIDLTLDTGTEEEAVVVDLTSLNDTPVVTFGEQPQQRSRRLRNQSRHSSQSPPTSRRHLDETSPETTVPRLSQVEDSPARVITCPICLDDSSVIRRTRRQLMSTICGHIFCNKCLTEVIKSRRTCPTCRKKLTKTQIHPIFL